MTTLPAELANLPLPNVIQELDYSARKTAFVSRLRAEFEAAGIPYDVDGEETDPGIILMQVAAYIDVNLRQRINEAVRANLLAFATGADLEHLAAFYEVSRLFAEGDEALRERVILAIRGRSTGGTAPRYASVARNASARVADVAIYTVGRDPTIHAAVFSTDNGGLADAALLAQVDLALQNPAVRMVNDRIVTRAAVRTLVDIEARIWMLPTAPHSAFVGLEPYLRSEWAKVGLLGFDMTRSWLTSRLMRPGVQRVEIVGPAADVVVPFNEAVAPGAVTLINMGQGY